MLRKKKKTRSNVTVMNLNGIEVQIHSNKELDKKKSKGISQYVANLNHAEEMRETFETLVNFDFFEGMAKVKILEITEEKIKVKIKF